jgi:deazaflavin-dependent oxidoreductase (nitroreductase family)
MVDTSEWDNIKAHMQLYREDPAVDHDWNAYGRIVPTLLLVATGRRTGRKPTRPLAYRKIGANYVIVASLGGAPTHPAWYVNLVANPAAEVQVGPDVIRVRARTAGGEERSRLWDRMVGALPPYADHQTRAGRELPVVVVEPRAQ